MRDRPQGHELLAIAARTFRETLLPALPEDRRYVALMVLNAMAIAGRQLEYGETALQAEAQALADCLGLASDPQASVDATLGALNRVLAQRVRNGALDDDPAAQRLLWAITLQKVRESAPRYLQAEGLE